jgi:hypothetical protein
MKQTGAHENDLTALVASCAAPPALGDRGRPAWARRAAAGGATAIAGPIGVHGRSGVQLPTRLAVRVIESCILKAALF